MGLALLSRECRKSDSPVHFQSLNAAFPSHRNGQKPDPGVINALRKEWKTISYLQT